MRLLVAHAGLSMAGAVTLASVAADLEIAQLVNDPHPTVTCSLGTDVLEGPSDLRDRIAGLGGAASA